MYNNNKIKKSKTLNLLYTAYCLINFGTNNFAGNAGDFASYFEHGNAGNADGDFASDFEHGKPGKFLAEIPR